MTFLERLRYLFTNDDARGFSLSGNTSFEQFFNLTDEDVIIVSEETAKSLSAVYTCLEVRAQDFAALPKGIFSKSDGNTTHHTEHNVNTLINRRPNSYQNAFDFWHILSKDADSYGNGLALIERDTRLNAIALHRLEPNKFQKAELTSSGLVYHFQGGQSYPAFDIFNVKNGSNDGIVGKSPLRTNKDTIGLAKRQEKYAKDVTGKKPPAVLSTDRTLRKEQFEQLQKQFEQQKRNGRTPILPEGLKYLPTVIPPSDIQLIEAMRLTANQIYGIYRVPPTIAQDYGNAAFNNPEHQALVYVKYGLLPKIIQVEQEINSKLLNRRIDQDKYTKINVNGLLRGDIAARTQFYREMIGVGVLSPNKALEMEDMDGYEGGDKRYVNTAMIPVDRVDEFWASKSADSGVPGVSNNLNGRQNGKHEVQVGHD